MRSIAFVGGAGGVGKTSLVYHLAWMYAELGLRVVAADLDPQASLTSMFVDEERLNELWSGEGERCTVYGAIQPLIEGTGDVTEPHVEPAGERIGLLVGDLALSNSEDELNNQWLRAMDRDVRAFRVISAFWRVLESGSRQHEADVVLIDAGPNLGAINRAALMAAGHMVIPLAPDLYSLQGLRNLGPRLRRWREEWSERRARNPVQGLSVPSGEMDPAGYIVLQHAVRLDRPMRAYDRWIQRIPGIYREYMLEEPVANEVPSVDDDPHCLATLKHYRSLMPLAQEARKPMFFLKPADGAIGGHAKAVQDCYRDFDALARTIAGRCDIPLG
jgi:chromosome partitioning protein